MNRRILNDIFALKDSKYKFDKYVEEDNSVTLFGEIEIIDPIDGTIWETVKVKILIPDDYPTNIPKTYLTSEIFPFSHDRHIGVNGGCCFAPLAEEYLILGRNYHLIDYIEKLAIPFFATQILFELEGEWPNGEYSHYTEGLIEYYKDKFRIKSVEEVIEALKVLAHIKRIGRNDPCFCSNDKKYKKCHLNVIEQFSFIPKEVFIDNLKEISKFKMESTILRIDSTLKVETLRSSKKIKLL